MGRVIGALLLTVLLLTACAREEPLSGSQPEPSAPSSSQSGPAAEEPSSQTGSQPEASSDTETAEVDLTGMSSTMVFAEVYNMMVEPESYEGGELVIEDTYGQHRVKLPAGHLVLYPASSLHCVTPVTRGVRQASFLWIQSMVRDDKQRAMLYDLDRTIQSLKARFGDGEEVLSLLNMYHNLLRQWTEV